LDQKTSLVSAIDSTTTTTTSKQEDEVMNISIAKPKKHKKRNHSELK